MTQMISVPCSFPEPLLPLSAVFMRAVSLVSALAWLPSIPTRHLHSGLGSEYLESIYRHHSSAHKPPSVSPLHVTFSPSHRDSHNTRWLTNIAAAVVVVVSCCCCLTAVVRVLTRCCVPHCCCLTTELSPAPHNTPLSSPGRTQTTLGHGAIPQHQHGGLKYLYFCDSVMILLYSSICLETFDYT